MKKYYKIAELTVEMDTYGRAERQAEKYLFSEEPERVDILIQPDVAKTLNRFPDMCLEDAEYMATGTSFHKQVMYYDGIMLHSSAVVLDGKAYLFTAPSGTGKSTHTSLWRKVFGETRAVIINDDKPVIRIRDGIWYAYGTPWSGKTPQNLNLSAPLAGICILDRGVDNEIQRCTPAEAIRPLMIQTTKPADMQSRIRILELMDKLIGNVPVWRMKCNMEDDAAIVSYEAMSGEKWEGI